MDLIRITEAESMPLADPKEWYVLEPKTFVRTRRRRSCSKSIVDREKPANDQVALEDFFARVAHLCEGLTMPPQPVVEVLGKQAILISKAWEGSLSCQGRCGTNRFPWFCRCRRHCNFDSG